MKVSEEKDMKLDKAKKDGENDKEEKQFPEENLAKKMRFELSCAMQNILRKLLAMWIF